MGNRSAEMNQSNEKKSNGVRENGGGEGDRCLPSTATKEEVAGGNITIVILRSGEMP